MIYDLRILETPTTLRGGGEREGHTHMGGGLLFKTHADRGEGGEIFLIFRGRLLCMSPIL